MTPDAKYNINWVHVTDAQFEAALKRARAWVDKHIDRVAATTLTTEGHIEREVLTEGSDMSTETQKMHLMTVGGRTFKFTHPIRVCISIGAELCSCECEAYNLMGYGYSYSAAMEQFRAGFEADWDLIAQEDDAKLTVDAQELKRKLLALVSSVEKSGDANEA